MASTIRVGVIGAGGNTKKMHIPLLQKIPGVTIQAVCNRSIESSSAAAKEFGIPKVHANWRDIINDNEVDAIVIGTWPYMHKTLTIAALQANKHVLCEARMAMNLQEAREMFEAAKERPHLVTQIVPSPFTLKFDRTIQRLVREKYLGKITYVDVTSVGNDFPNFDSPLTWRQDADKSGLNIMDMGIWVEALFRWVGTAKSVFASASTVVSERTNPETNALVGVHVPDHVDILAELACGAKARFQFSAVLGLGGTKKLITLYGTDGTIQLDYLAGVLKAGKKGQAELTPVEIPSNEEGSWNVENEFIDAIRGKAPVQLTTFTDGVKYMQFTQAVFDSYTSGRQVVLPIV